MTRYNNSYHGIYFSLLHFVAFFHVDSLFYKGVDTRQQKSGDRQWKSSRAGQQNIIFILQPDFNVKLSPKNATKQPVV